MQRLIPSPVKSFQGPIDTSPIPPDRNITPQQTAYRNLQSSRYLIGASPQVNQGATIQPSFIFFPNQPVFETIYQIPAGSKKQVHVFIPPDTYFGRFPDQPEPRRVLPVGLRYVVDAPKILDGATKTDNFFTSAFFYPHALPLQTPVTFNNIFQPVIRDNYFSTNASLPDPSRVRAYLAGLRYLVEPVKRFEGPTVSDNFFSTNDYKPDFARFSQYVAGLRYQVPVRGRDDIGHQSNIPSYIFFPGQPDRNYAEYIKQMQGFQYFLPNELGNFGSLLYTCPLDAVVTLYLVPRATVAVVMPIAYVTSVNTMNEKQLCTPTATTIPATGAFSTIIELSGFPLNN